MSVTTMHDEVDRAMEAVLKTLHDKKAPLYATDILLNTRECGFRDEAVRHAIWRLIAAKKAILDEKRRVAIAA